MTPSRKLIVLLKEKNLTLSLAESMTCGMAASMLAAAPGTSDVFLGSIVCYHEEVKTCVLRVSNALIKKHTAESQEVTHAMALQLKKLIPAHVCAAVTGLDSEGGSETKTKPVGTVFFSIRIGAKTHHFRKKFNGSPMQIRKKACAFLFGQIHSLCTK